VKKPHLLIMCLATTRNPGNPEEAIFFNQKTVDATPDGYK
jgi:hypothetical protein